MTSKVFLLSKVITECIFTFGQSPTNQSIQLSFHQILRIDQTRMDYLYVTAKSNLFDQHLMLGDAAIMMTGTEIEIRIEIGNWIEL